MFEKLRIKEHMEIAEQFDGEHIGTVDKVEDDTHQAWTKSDSADHMHHYRAVGRGRSARGATASG